MEVANGLLKIADAPNGMEMSAYNALKNGFSTPKVSASKSATNVPPGKATETASPAMEASFCPPEPVLSTPTPSMAQPTPYVQHGKARGA